MPLTSRSRAASAPSGAAPASLPLAASSFGSLAAPTYFVAALLTGFTILDFTTSIMPFGRESAQWRFGAAVLLSGFLLTPLLGLVLAAGTARLAGHARVERVLAVVEIVGALLLVAIAGLLALDMLQLRREVRAEQLVSFNLSGMRALVKLLGASVALAWLALASLRARRAVRHATRVDGGGAGSRRTPIIVAQPEPTTATR